MAATCDLYLVRHGLTLWNLEKRYLGYTDQELVQGETWRIEPLRKSLEQVQFDAIYCSDLLRCQQTLQIIYPGCDKNVSLEPALREIHFGNWEGQTYEHLKDDATYRQWLEDPMKFSPLEGETLRQFQQRVDSFMDRLFNQLESNHREKRNDYNHVQCKDNSRQEDSYTKQHLLVVTHGGVIRQFLSRLVPGRSFWEWEIKNGSALKLQIARQKEVWECYSWSEVPMQEKEQQLEGE